MKWRYHIVTTLLSAALCLPAAASTSHEGYYRHPALHGNELIFTSEGDLWSTTLNQKLAHRLTSRRTFENDAVISNDGTQVAYTADYAGEPEVYVMPVAGGLPKRVTFEQSYARAQGWTNDGRILYTTDNVSGPNRTYVLKLVDPKTLKTETLPLLNANQGSLDEQHGYLYFSRFGSDMTGDHLRSYKGGAQGEIWRYKLGTKQEMLLTQKASNSFPMYYQGRVYYVSDASGTPNLWSMKGDGSQVKQLTFYRKWPVRMPTLSQGVIVYQLGADLVRYNIASNQSHKLDISLVSDEPYRQQRWIKYPADYLTHVALTPDTQRVVITARGKVVVASSYGTRLVKIQTPKHSRTRYALMSADKQWIYAICDASGEEEIWRFAADGSNSSKQLTHGGHSIRWSLNESPNGQYLLTDDKDGNLWLVDTQTGKSRTILTGGPAVSAFGHYSWSADGRYLAVSTMLNHLSRHVIILYDVHSGHHQQLTSNKYNSFSARFSPDGNWLYFLSDRTFNADPDNPWGDRNFDPAFKRRTGVYAIALHKDALFPFEKQSEQLEQKENAEDKPQGKQTSSIDWDGIKQRLWQVPVVAGDYEHLSVAKERLYLLDWRHQSLKTIAFTHGKVYLDNVSDGISAYSLSADKTGLLVHHDGDMYIVPAQDSLPDNMDDYLVNLDNWQMRINPQDEWMQMFQDAWLMHRDRFYDKKMRGVDWQAVKEQMQPLVARVSDRDELGDLLGQMTGTLNTLHSQIGYGDTPDRIDSADSASLGAQLKQTDDGVQIAHIYRVDPELPAQQGPLARPGVDVKNGDIILTINNKIVSDMADVMQALRNQAGQQVVMDVERGKHWHKVVVYPFTPDDNEMLRYADWAQSNREKVAQQSQNKIGYIYLNGMGGADIATFVREFAANSDKQGLIIDVRNNWGGSVDSWIIDKLLRRAWMFWKDAHGNTYTNMQDAFRGHLVVLANQLTYSDGETFTAGVKALGLGKVVGMRTSGAGVWLDNDNRLSDRGIARGAELPQFLMNGQWIIEQKGVTPDIKVDNLPLESFAGQDLQLEKGIQYLQKQIASKPLAPLKAAPMK